MKVIQLNLWQGRLLPAAIQFLRSENPDIICLQEVYSNDPPAPSFDYLSSLEAIVTAFPDYQYYYSPMYSFGLLDTTFDWGSAILSRFPIRDQKTTFINGEPSRYKDMATLAQYGNQRNLQQITVEMPDSKALTVINHHGFWDKNPLGNEESIQKMERVAEIIKGVVGPVVFCGDLNLKSESPAMKPLTNILRSLTQVYNVPSTLNQFGKVHDVACDHICISDDIKVTSFTVSEALVSDHKPLVMEFEIS